jgi:1,3-propanediol dehydrogenase/alcohol dehydrogenase
MNPWRIYQHSNPGKLIFGPNSLNQLTTELPSKEVPLIITDKGVLNAGILSKLTAVLDGAGIHYHIFDGIEPDPSFETVEKAAAAYQDKGCTLLIGLGGGSSIDGAKAVSLRVSRKGDIREYGMGKVIEGTLVPIYAIPTTAGTGSEVTGVAVITDRENKLKRVLRGAQFIPKTVILDPELLASIPSKIAAETGADALVHAVESYVSFNSNVITESFAISAIRLIARYLRRMVADPSDIETSGQMLLGSCLAGLSFSNAGLGLVHSLAHPVGAYYHFSHGLSCALYLPFVMDFNLIACPEKFASIAEAMGEEVRQFSPHRAAKQAVFAVRDLFSDIGIPRTFSELGISFELHPNMVDNALAAVPTTLNPRRANKDQISMLFKAPCQEWKD